jgi:hypothetical protein
MSEGLPTKLFEMTPVARPASTAVVLRHATQALFDARLAGSTDRIVVEPRRRYSKETDYRNLQGRVIYQGIAISRKKHPFLIVELESPHDMPIGVEIADRAGNRSFRYYPGLQAARRNFVALAWEGFPGIEKLEDEITEVTLFMYTADLERRGVDAFQIVLGPLAVLPDQVALWRFMRERKATIHEEK